MKRRHLELQSSEGRGGGGMSYSLPFNKYLHKVDSSLALHLRFISVK